MNKVKTDFAEEDSVTIPKSLNETVEYLTKLAGDDVDSIGSMTVDTFVACSHHSLGRWIRNNWNLWKEKGPLYEELKKLGFTHADDMSSVILKNFYHSTKGEKFDIKAYELECKRHWEQYK